MEMSVCLCMIWLVSSTVAIGRGWSLLILFFVCVGGGGGERYNVSDIAVYIAWY